MMSSVTIVTAILVLLALVALFVFLGRLVELRRAHIDYTDFINGVVNVLESGTEAEALAICEDTATPVSAVVATAIRNRHATARTLREAVDAAGRAATGRLDRRLATLAIIGQIAPSLGLLGTIVGLMKTIMLVNANVLVSRAELVSSAMGTLVAAAAGLAVAIPVGVMYGILRVRFERIVVDLEAAASSILGYIAREEVKK